MWRSITRVTSCARYIYICVCVCVCVNIKNMHTYLNRLWIILFYIRFHIYKCWCSGKNLNYSSKSDVFTIFKHVTDVNWSAISKNLMENDNMFDYSDFITKIQRLIILVVRNGNYHSCAYMCLLLHNHHHYQT